MSVQPDVILGERFSRALEWVVDLQGTEGRKGSGIPYLAHTLSVVSIVLAYGGNEEQAVAAALHDVAEDSGGEAALTRIRMDFGDDVAELVESLSDSLTESKAEKAPWWERKAAYIEKLKTESSDVALVSAADKLDNIRSIRADHRRQGAELWSIFNKDSRRTGQLWYYGTLVEVLEPKLRNERGSNAQTDIQFRLQCDLAADLRREFDLLLLDVSQEEGTTPEELRAEYEAAGEKHRQTH